jgi:diadenosine tetraphosphatase ApaH/serine/threonine PP2A family protein phosphatase
LICGHGMISIRGNHDRWLVEVPPEQQSGSEASAWPQLSPSHRQWLHELPAVRTIGGQILMCHGTPASDTEYFLERVTSAGNVELDKSNSIVAKAGPTECSLILCGHTHVARRVDLPDGRTVLNPGSVGCPGYRSTTPYMHRVEAGSPVASYALVERRGSNWITAIRGIPYDATRMIALARRSVRPGWGPILSSGRVEDHSADTPENTRASLPHPRPCQPRHKSI